MSFSIVLVDDHKLVRDGVKTILERGAEFRVVGEAENGADALRFTLAALAGQGSDVKLSVKRIEGYRHFCNKIWNAHRFLAPHLQEAEGREARLAELPLDLADRWILSRMNAVTRGVDEAFAGYRFNDAASLLYQFLWHEYCDWYVEIVKTRLASADVRVRASSRVGSSTSDTASSLIGAPSRPRNGAGFRYSEEWISSPVKSSRPGQSGTNGSPL